MSREVPHHHVLRIRDAITRERGVWLPLVMVAAVLGFSATLVAQMATPDRLRGAGWWPTKRTAARADFVGASECVRCHPSKATQLATAMARTAQRAADSPVLGAGKPLTFAVGHYSYSIRRNGAEPHYTVTDGERTISAPLAWALGAGNVGQTYIFARDGSLHEARASYYATVQRLDFTPNRRLETPRAVEEAMARPVDEAEARRCFGCHTTASSTASGFDLSTAIPGVTCEACHGPGRSHVEEIARGGTGPDTIFNPAGLEAADSVDFCGACHATFWDVTLANERGLAALRSQPFRLQSSPCWQEGDDRLTCVACHDPHKPLVRDSASYDVRCLACHQPSARGASKAASAHAPGCTAGTENCAGCHMPKYEVPDMHFAFTDHLIRIVRK